MECVVNDLQIVKASRSKNLLKELSHLSGLNLESSNVTLPFVSILSEPPFERKDTDGTPSFAMFPFSEGSPMFPQVDDVRMRARALTMQEEEIIPSKNYNMKFSLSTEANLKTTNDSNQLTEEPEIR